MGRVGGIVGDEMRGSQFPEEDARKTFWLDEAWRFIAGWHDDLSCDLAGGLQVLFMGDETGLRMFLEIPRDLQVSAYRDAYPALAEWRRRLNLVESGRPAQRERVWTELESLRLRKRQSYRQVAEYANQRAVKLLQEALRWDNTPLQPFAIEDAVEYLGYLGIGENEARRFCEGCIENIREGYAPYPPDGGIVDRDHVIERLRYRKEQRKQRWEKLASFGPPPDG
jgi:hypothetical protein